MIYQKERKGKEWVVGERCEIATGGGGCFPFFSHSQFFPPCIRESSVARTRKKGEGGGSKIGWVGGFLLLL